MTNSLVFTYSETCIQESLKVCNNCPVCNSGIESEFLFPNLARKYI